MKSYTKHPEIHHQEIQSIFPLHRRNATAKARSNLVHAIQSTPALWTLVEIINREARRGDPYRELQLIINPRNLHNVQPQEQNLQTIRCDRQSN